MAFKVLLHPNASKELKKLGKATKARILKALEELTVDPSRAGKPSRLPIFGA